jgi:DNA-binding CsgD family transcriptional regulator
MVPRDHFVYENMSNVFKIAQPFTGETGIILMNYVQHRNDGSFFSLCNEISDWASHVYDNYLNNKSFLNSRNQSGINYWRSNKEISEINTDARDNFDIDARIEFVWYDVQNDFYHLFSFYAKKKNADKAYKFYSSHQDKLLKFIAHFNREAKDLIREGEKPENRIYIPNYTLTGVEQKFRNYAEEAKKKGIDLDLKNNEFQCMLLYAHGCTVNQVAEMLCRSPKTVEHYKAEIRYKTGCKDRKELMAYVRDHGWQDLIGFFLNYLPPQGCK